MGPGGYQDPNGNVYAPVNSSTGETAPTYGSAKQPVNQPAPGSTWQGQAQQAPAQQPAAPPAQSNGLTSEQQSAKAQLQADLANAGFSGSDLASLGDFAWNEFLNGVPQTQIMLDIRGRPEYQRRFPGMAELVSKGRAISEAQYIQYERDATGILTYAGLGQYANPQYLGGLIGGEVSITELGDRVQNGYEKVIEAPPEVRQVFDQWFGPNSDAALAGWFLDPNHTEPFIRQAIQEAQAGGYGKFFGFDISQDAAKLIGQIAPTAGQLVSGYQRAIDYKPLTYETISESTDLTQDQTVEAAFGTSGDAIAAFRKRLDERAAQSRGGGGALETNTGLIGAGAAEQ